MLQVSSLHILVILQQPEYVPSPTVVADSGCLQSKFIPPMTNLQAEAGPFQAISTIHTLGYVMLKQQEFS